MILEPTNLETHPGGTGSANAIVVSNWTLLNAWLKKAPYRFDSGTIDGTAIGTTQIQNQTGQSILPRAFLIQPVTFASIITPPTLEIGNPSDDEEFLDSTLLTLNADTLVERLEAKTLITPIADDGYLDIEIATAATATTYDFKILTIFDFLP